MIKVWCDMCDQEIIIDQDTKYSLSVIVNFDTVDSHKIIDEPTPTSYNKTYCSACYDAMTVYFTEIF